MAERGRPSILRPADDVYGWVEQESSVMFKAATRDGDPVELTAEEARAVAKALVELAARLEALG
jgi:hypothetical protein